MSRLNDEKNILGYWPLNGHADDLVRGNDGTWSGTERYTDGPFGKQISDYNGGADYVNVGTGASPASGDFTVSAWVDIATLGATKVIISNRENGAPWTGFYLVVSVGNQLNYQLNDQSNFHVYSVGVKTLSANILHHVCLVVDRTNDLGHLYIDGKADVTNTNISAVSGSILSTQDMWIGRDAAVGSNMNGSIGNVKLYNIALTADEIHNLFKMDHRS